MGLIRTACTSCAVLVLLVALGVGLWLQELEQARGPNAEWVNWIGEFSCGSDVKVERPKTLEELQAAVRRHKKVRAAATGRSFSFFHCPSGGKGAVIDMMALRHAEVRQLESGEYAVTAEAGIEMGNLQNMLLARGLTFRVPPGNPGYSVGGVAATSSHNLGQAHVQDMLEITFVTHDGSLRTARRGDDDFSAAAVSHGRLGVIYRVTYLVLPYRQFAWSMETHAVPDIDGVLQGAMELANNISGSGEEVYGGNKMVLYLAEGVMLKEFWMAQGRGNTPILDDSAEPLKPYNNSLMFRLGQGMFSRTLKAALRWPFSVTPIWLLQKLQKPCETVFRSLHTAAALQKVRQAVGWQHSPQSRGDMSAKPSGNQYTWAGWLDEAVNFIMLLEHMEVIFPLEPLDKAKKCLEIVFAHTHLMWWRFNIRVMPSDDWYLSPVYMEGAKQPMVRVDFVMPTALLDLPSGAASLTSQLQLGCPGWRNHWGKGMHKSFSDMRFGKPDAFHEVASRWDPEGKFRPMGLPTWTETPR
eukprot:TRINITY_DN25916_c0_g1_i1.p1 TRINITY_DN25916_c0_g1~~TRINITY_DN25916_c0_g1_i1.p1  ORF type:complete len:526 (+),score=149.13 TRINITY_DN25916_c0_g1_i1:112-1689(+)